MPDDRRLLRLQQLVLETVASTVQRDLDDPRIGLVTITKVKLAKDLTQAVVYWSCLDDGGPRRTAERGLADALPVIQRAVAGAIGTRQTPHLSLRFDRAPEHAGRIDSILAKLARERGDPPAPTDAAAGESPGPATGPGPGAPGAPPPAPDADADEEQG
jgi:ribosome-binding factor A